MTVERIAHVAPLGLRFWDDGAGALVADDLVVTAAPATRPGDTREAQRNASGAYVFHALRGLDAFARGELGTDRSTPIAAPQLFRVSVTHGRGGYLPVSFLCDAPQWGFASSRASRRAPRPLVPVSTVAPAPSMPLFPSASLTPRGGAASVRAELRIASLTPVPRFELLAPASWALVEALLGTQIVGRGLADAEGRVLMTFPHPRPAPTVTPARWSLTFRVFHVTRAAVKRADLDDVMASPSRDLRPWGTPPFASTLTRELRPNLSLDLGAPELQP